MLCLGLPMADWEVVLASWAFYSWSGQGITLCTITLYSEAMQYRVDEPWISLLSLLNELYKLGPVQMGLNYDELCWIRN